MNDNGIISLVAFAVMGLVIFIVVMICTSPSVEARHQKIKAEERAKAYRKDMTDIWNERCYKGYAYVVYAGNRYAAMAPLLDEDGKPVPCMMEESNEK